jgi:Family of unknown function (DUF5996)
MAEPIRTAAARLPALELADWEATKTTLHLWLQIVGKIRLASAAPRNHWWHAALYLDVRGLTTRRLHAANGIVFEIAFDFVDHRLVVTTNRGASESFRSATGCPSPPSIGTCMRCSTPSGSRSRSRNRRTGCP